MRGLLACLLLLPVATKSAQPVEHVIPTRKLAYLDMRFRQLMLDQYVIDRHSGVTKIFPQAKLDPKPLLECTFPNEMEAMALNMPSTIWDAKAGKHRMWYYNIWRLPVDQGYLFGALGYAESRDGLAWTKPILEQQDYKGNGKANNVIGGLGLSQWVTSVTLGHDNQIRCYLTPHENTAILTNGIHAGPRKRFSFNPITNLQQGRAEVGPLVNDLIHVMYDPVLKRYLATVRTWAPLSGSKEQSKWRRAVAIYTSEDGVKWHNTKYLLQTDLAFDHYVENLPHRERHDLPAWSEFHDLPVQRYERLIIGLNGILFFYDEDIAKQREIAGTETAYFLGWSRDGYNWSRTFERQPLIDMPKGTEEWGRHTIGSPFMVVHEKEIRLYHDVGRGHSNRTYKTPKPKQIRLSRLRRDGFAGWQSGPAGGWVQTAPFEASGQLRINADAKAGAIHVEALEVIEERQHTGPRRWKPISGFQKADSKALSGDCYNAPTEWKSAQWEDLHGKLIALRFHLTNATLYSFWTRKNSGSDLVVNLFE